MTLGVRQLENQCSLQIAQVLTRTGFIYKEIVVCVQKQRCKPIETTNCPTMKSAILIVLAMIMHFANAQNGLQASYDLSTQTKDDHLTVNECPSSYVSRKLTCFLQVPVGEVLTLIFATCGGIDDPVFVCNNKWRVSNPRPTVVKVLLTSLPYSENKI